MSLGYASHFPVEILRTVFFGHVEEVASTVKHWPVGVISWPVVHLAVLVVVVMQLLVCESNVVPSRQQSTEPVVTHWPVWVLRIPVYMLL